MKEIDQTPRLLSKLLFIASDLIFNGERWSKDWIYIPDQYTVKMHKIMEDSGYGLLYHTRNQYSVVIPESLYCQSADAREAIRPDLANAPTPVPATDDPDEIPF